MYCPRCLNSSLQMKQSGVANVVLNHKQMDRGRFLYNLDRQSQHEVNEEFKKKVVDFFRWYSNFKNQDPIEHIEIYSNDFYCTNGCPIGPNDKFSLIGELINYSVVVEVITEIAKKYEIGVELPKKKI